MRDGNGNGNGNGRRKKSQGPYHLNATRWKRPKKTSLADDDFSRELGRQGEAGLKMRVLYLNPWPKTYKTRVTDDEPLRG